MLINLPIEPYEERYTAQLNNWVEMELEKHNVEYVTVYGDTLSDTIDEGQVLDGTGRPYYCLTQMSKIMKMMRNNEIKSGDKIFTTDIWIHGLEAIPYAATIQKKNIELYGFNCAGTFEKYDFLNQTGMTKWGQYLEKAWFKAAKKIFFASNTLRQMAYEAEMFWGERKKAIVTGLAFNSTDVYNTIEEHPEKENIVIFPHRWDNEKRPDMFLLLATIIKEQRPDIRFIITTGRKKLGGTADTKNAINLQQSRTVEIYEGMNKVDYYRLLAKSKIIFSSALQDTIGNCMLEAITHGCTPVATDDVSYHEYLPEEFLYYTIFEATIKVLQYIDKPVDCFKYIEKYDNSIENMLIEMEVV